MGMPGKKLLVADDSLTIQKVIRLALSNEGYEIQTISDGNDAIQQISLSQPDIVLIDVSLPGKTAFEVKREINQHEDLKEIRFVLMSSAFEKVDEAQAQEVTFHGQLTKPFDPAHLRQVLNDVLAQISAKRAEKTSILTRLPVTSELPPPFPKNLENVSFYPPPLPSDLPTPFPENESSAHSLLQEDSIESDLPTLPLPPTQEPVETLWEFNQAPPESTGETDIKELTDSTMRISSMEDYQWNVNEPTLKPMPKMLDQGGSTFNLGQQPYENATPSPLSPPPLLKTIQPPTPPIIPPPLPPQPETHSHPSPPKIVASAINQDQIETLIRNEVQNVLEKMSQKLLPDLAEKIIKQEIHRILSE